MWGCSSAGRALPSQGRGREFKSLHLHHHDDQRSDIVRPLFFRLFVQPSPSLPFGESLPRGVSMNSVRSSSELHQKKTCLLSERAKMPAKRRNACPAAPALRLFVRPSLADACPARAQAWPEPSDPAAASLRPCRKSGQYAFPAPALSGARLSTVMHRPTAIFPASPRLIPRHSAASALHRGFQRLPLRYISDSSHPL